MAGEQVGFDGLAGFPSLEQVHESESLFPRFANRLPPRSRPEYGESVRWEEAGRALSVAVERVNPAPAPLQLRLLCNLTSRWPARFKPFAGDPYEPVSEGVTAACVA